MNREIIKYMSEEASWLGMGIIIYDVFWGKSENGANIMMGFDVMVMAAYLRLRYEMGKDIYIDLNKIPAKGRK